MDNISIFTLNSQPADTRYLEIGGQTIEVYPFPTTERILEAIQWGLNFAVQDSEIVSAAVKTIFLEMSIVKAFTNIEIDFVDKTVSDVYKVYDTILLLNLIEEIKGKVSSSAFTFFVESFTNTVDNVITYRQSAAGILNEISTNAKTSTEAMQESMDYASRPENLERLSKVVDMAEKLGYNPA